MNKKAIYDQIKKEIKKNYKVLELDELYWFIIKKNQKKKQDKIYIITMINR